jgi:2-polyprenyl-3-methyl-5-hydroxy-6-metoxy-1,4-benzoquinol methylase
VARAWDQARFESDYARLIVGGRFNEERAYYPRYRSRYEHLLRRFAALSPTEPLDVLDIGGGQLGLMCKALWGDRVRVSDIGGEHLQYLGQQGVATTRWNLCTESAPFRSAFDVVFFSEVIEHLPVPGHVVLQKLRSCLRPGGVLICSTPNLYRLRNVVYMALGIRIFDFFRVPVDEGLGHVLEYSAEHLQWQMQTAGYAESAIEFVQMHHSPNNPLFRLLYWMGSPLFAVPRFRDNLVAVAVNPEPRLIE